MDKNAILKQFIPAEQLKVARASREFDEILDNTANLINDMPVSYEQDGLRDNAFIFLHYFVGNSDWYITEKDMGDATNKDFGQQQAFGLAILGDDIENAEMGYISIDGSDGLVSIKGMNLDFHFTPTPLKELKEIKGMAIRLSDELNEKQFHKVLNIAEKYGYENIANMEEETETEAEVAKSTNYITELPTKPIVVDASVEPDTDKMKMSDGWVKYQKVGTYGFKAKKKFEFSNYAYAAQAYNEIKGYSISPIPVELGKDANSFAIVIRDDSNTKDLIDRIYQKIDSQKPKQIDTIEETKVSPAADIQQDINANATPLNAGKTRNENWKDIRKLIDEKGTDISKYSEAELRYIRTYEGSRNDLSPTKYPLTQLYTPDNVAEKMWGLAEKHGFDKSKQVRVCNPFAGIGSYLEYAPINATVDAYECDKYGYTIAKLTFPKMNIHNEGYANMLHSGNRFVGFSNVPHKYDLFIGTLPEASPCSNNKAVANDDFEKSMEGTFAKNTYQYAIATACELLKKDGLMAFLVPSTFMTDEHEFNEFKTNLLKSCTLVDGYRLPDSIIEESNVATDIIVLKKIK